MKANLKNALMIVAALLVAYASAFLVTMEVVEYPLPTYYPPAEYRFRIHAPRWGSSKPWYLLIGQSHWMVTFFAPLIWVEHQVLPPEYWHWKTGEPKPDWAK